MATERVRVMRGADRPTLADDAITASVSAARLPLRVKPEALRDELHAAISAFDTRLDLTDARLSTLQKRRVKLRRAVRALAVALNTHDTRDLLERLRGWPLAQQFNGAPLPKDYGRLRESELLVLLREFDTALTVRGGLNDDSQPEDDGDCPAWPALVGDLHDAFIGAFGRVKPSQSAGAFERFAGAILDAAEVGHWSAGRRVKMNAKSIKDALRTYRAWRGKGRRRVTRARRPTA